MQAAHITCSFNFKLFNLKSYFKAHRALNSQDGITYPKVFFEWAQQHLVTCSSPPCWPFCRYQQHHPPRLITHFGNTPSAPLWTSSVAFSMTVRCSVMGRTSSHETAARPTRHSCHWLMVVLIHPSSCSLEAAHFINTPSEGEDALQVLDHQRVSVLHL